MGILLRGILVLVFTSFLCTSCADAAPPVSLALPTDVQEGTVYSVSAYVSDAYTPDMPIRYVPLKALNKNARAGAINDPEKSGTMYFAFEKSPDMLGLTGSALYALGLEFEPLPTAVKSGGAALLKTISEEAPSNGNLKSEMTGTAQTLAVREELNSVQTHPTEFTVGLLYASDFSNSGKLKEDVRPQHPVTARTLPKRAFTVSIGFAGIAVPPADIRGFMVSSQAALKLKSATVVPVRYGWIKDRTALWYGTTADGGVILPELCAEAGLPARTEFPKPSTVIHAGNTGIGDTEIDGRDSIVIHFDASAPVSLTTKQKQLRLSFQCGGKHISVYRAPELYRLTLDGCLFHDSFLTIAQTDTDRLTHSDSSAGTNGLVATNSLTGMGRLAHSDNLTGIAGLTDSDSFAPSDRLANMGSLTDTDWTGNPANTICGITAEYYAPPPLTPITADPGLILHWPQEQWRQLSYELFVWEQFPSVLIFDFADYAVQDAYLKRISFFAEKKGFTGKLLSDKAIDSLHGFNAHDYRAEMLAAFFQKAEEEHFLLNKSELHLRRILFHNGIIVRSEQGIETGSGAIVSISRQSPAYLRYRFITHECLHGIYFTEKNFRDTVSAVFQQTDPRAVLFLRRYFEIYPTLQYNTDDDYLLQNEFMAYLLQQSNGSLQQYYNRVSWFRMMNEAEPALCRYIRKTNAEAFMQAAAQMSSFLYAAYGLKGGRIHLAEAEAL